MLCFSKKEKLEDHPRVTRGMGDRRSSVLFLTHQPGLSLCKPEFNRPLTFREVNLIDNGLAHYGATILDYYTINIVKCPVEKLSLPVFRKCFDNHTEEIIMDDQFTHIIGIGEQVAKYVFSRGKAPPPMDMLCGRPITQFDFPGKKLFFTYHPTIVLNGDRTDMEKYDDITSKFNLSIRKLGAFLKEEGLT